MKTTVGCCRPLICMDLELVRHSQLWNRLYKSEEEEIWVRLLSRQDSCQIIISIAIPWSVIRPVGQIVISISRDKEIFGWLAGTENIHVEQKMGGGGTLFDGGLFYQMPLRKFWPLQAQVNHK